MSSFLAYVTKIERGTAKNGKAYWKVGVQVDGNEHTLWCWDFNQIAEVSVNQNAEFTVEKNGDFLNVLTAVPAVDVNAGVPIPGGDVTALGGPEPAWLSDSGGKTSIPAGNVLPHPPTPAFPQSGERNKVHSIIRQTAWKCAAALCTYEDDALGTIKEVQRIIEADMLSV